MTRSAALWLTLAALPWPAACSTTEVFACASDAQCVSEQAAGRCEPEGVCSFPDDSCPSGHRYGGLAGALSGECVGEGSSSHATADTGMTSLASETMVATTHADGSGTASVSTSTSSPETTSTTAPETTTSPTTNPASATSTGPEPETTGGVDPGAYGPCMDAVECPVEGICLLDLDVCAATCMEDQDCPPAPGGGVSIECRTFGSNDTGCVITCSSDDECLVGMACMGNICGWP